MTDARTLVIGGGVAGLSAAAWLHDLELPFDWWMADDAVGGTLRRVGNPVRTLLGLETAHGAALVERFDAHVSALGIRPVPRRRVARLSPAGRRWQAHHAGGVADFDAVLIATGTGPRHLGLDGERELLGRGVEQSVTRTRARYRDARCVVVGGGDAALEGALLLSEVTDAITIVHRSSAFRAQDRFVERVSAHPSITVRYDDEVTGLIRGDDGRLTGVRTRRGDVLHADGLFVRIGVTPMIPAVDGGLDRDTAGYVVTTRDGRTSRPGLYAAGDVTGAGHQSIAAAQGDAARAVASIAADLFTSG